MLTRENRRVLISASLYGTESVVAVYRNLSAPQRAAAREWLAGRTPNTWQARALDVITEG